METQIHDRKPCQATPRPSNVTLTPHLQPHSAPLSHGQAKDAMEATPTTVSWPLLCSVSWLNACTSFTWANWIVPMSAGGLSLLLSETPHQFTGLQTIGKIVFIFDLTTYLALCFALLYRFLTVRSSFKSSLTHPTEALFFPTFLLATVNVLNCTKLYGGPATGEWLIVTMRVLFWIYVAVSFVAATVQYYILFGVSEQLTIQSMSPAWILPAFSATLAGTLAGIVSQGQPPEHRISIIVAGVTFQGFGWIVSLIMYALLLNRLLQYGLPAPNMRPGMYITVGPPAFTSLALMTLAENVPTDYGYFAAHPTAPEILQVVATFVAIFLWMVSFFFFCIATISVLAGARKMSFQLVWWAMVFPNVGFTIATSSIGRVLESSGILWLASAMTVLVVIVWMFVLVAQIRAVYMEQIYMPGKDEDKDEYKLDDELHGIFLPPRLKRADFVNGGHLSP